LLRALVLRIGRLGMIESGELFDLTTNRAWRKLEAKLRPFIARRIRAEADADDVLQDVFVRIQRGLPSLRDDQRFGPWVYQVARSAVIDHVRSSARHPIARREPAVEDELGADEPDPSSVERQVAEYAALLVSMLPSPYREALTLTELEGLTQKQAAEMLGISVSTMKSRVQRGRRKLRVAIEDCCQIALDSRRRVIGCEPRADGKLPDGCCT
jgi:RNA polymerase sigma-70 factor, ECF subfamily